MSQRPPLAFPSQGALRFLQNSDGEHSANDRVKLVRRLLLRNRFETEGQIWFVKELIYALSLEAVLYSGMQKLIAIVSCLPSHPLTCFHSLSLPKTAVIPEYWVCPYFISVPEFASGGSTSRIYKICKEGAGARISSKSSGNRKLLFCLNVLWGRCCDVDIDVYIYSVDFEKAFEKIHDSKVAEPLLNTGSRESCTTGVLHWQQTSALRVGYLMSVT